MESNKNWKENIDKYELIESLVKDSFFNQLKTLKINEKFWSYPYFNTTFSNGEKFADGNPMFSVFDKRQNKIIKVIIEESCGNYEILTTSFDDKKLVTIIISLNELKDLGSIFRTALLFEL